MRMRCLLMVLLVLLCCASCAKDVPPPAPEAKSSGPLATVLLLADEDGKVGRVVVTDIKGNSVVLNKERETVDVGPALTLLQPDIMGAEEANARFGDLDKALPQDPVVFILYFKGKTTTLTNESKQLIADIGKAFRKLNSNDISIVGHTDRSGDQKYNLLISEKRAQLVSRVLFKQQRIPWLAMEVVSHGEAFPLVQTGDSKANRQNQRVEVTIR